MENYWNLGRWAGIPVSMHWTVLLAFPWLFLWTRSFIGAAIGSAAFLALLIAHEFGHVLAARWRKVYVEEIRLYGMHGHTALGYKRTEVDEAWIAWGGVAVQFVLLLLAYFAEAALPIFPSPLLQLIAGPVLAVLTTWNIFLMIVALLPLGPMDGQAAWRAFPLMREALRRKRRAAGAPKLTL